MLDGHGDHAARDASAASAVRELMLRRCAGHNSKVRSGRRRH